ncbi:hypothetical protein PV726_08175 [Streptomyces europaeiscabiei]|uniref:hypothetical protein n=1 Tax=Streptomyces europaeiscabiei TaxID=146819 RepID=UPI0029A0A2A0|nr:hypothetical protein [Streptomyces europaeiscabiei]MDX3690299.1 hypothetical protein [Streptomyces europaeiscabiei]
MHTFVAVAALTTLLAGASTTSYAVSRGETAHGAGTTVAESAARKAPTPRIVQPGEHVVAAPGFEFWMTAEGKHWLEPDLPDFPQFRSVVDGNIDRSRPGVSLQASAFEDRYYLSGVYYGGKGTASRVEVRTSTGKVHGKLIELPGKPGWGVWYAIADLPTVDDGQEFLRGVTVHDTKGGVYSRLRLR